MAHSPARSTPRRLVPLIIVAVATVGLGSCSSDDESDTDLGMLSQDLAGDGMAVVEKFRTDEPRLGEVTAENQTGDAGVDVTCDGGGTQHVWGVDLTLAWPGDPTDMDAVDTLLDGTAAFSVVGSTSCVG